MGGVRHILGGHFFEPISVEKKVPPIAHGDPLRELEREASTVTLGFLHDSKKRVFGSFYLGLCGGGFGEVLHGLQQSLLQSV